MSEAPGDGRSARNASGNGTFDPLRSSVAYVKNVGPHFAEVLAKMGITRAFGLLFFFPRDYQEVFLKRSVDELVEGETQSVCGVIEDYSTRYSRVGMITTLWVSLGADRVRGTWFGVEYVVKGFYPGRPLIMTGSPKRKDGVWTFSHPTLVYLNDEFDRSEKEFDPGSELEELRILPVYRLTEGIGPVRMRRIMKNALVRLPDLLPEALPDALLTKRGLPRIADAIRNIHFPKSLEDARNARRRFAYQELLTLQLALAICRTRRRVNMKAIPLPRSAKIDSRIRALFPFELTDAQLGAIREISEDMGKSTPMNRLLQGDVGAGKTAVALYAALQAIANGAQTAVMAPTEALARQHLRTFKLYLRNSSVKVVPLFGGQSASERAQILDEIRSGEAQIVVGTQALVCNNIEFKRLGLVVIDEQHKFGVKQRAALKSAPDVEPHYLVMTATPIPRSLTMTLFGDLDVSVMRGLPSGRRKTTTTVLTPDKRASWWKFVREQLDAGRQAYVVVPRVDNGKGDVELNLFADYEIKKLENDGSQSADFDFWNNWEGPEKERAYLREARKKANRAQGDDETEPDEEEKEHLKTVWSVYKELSEGELKGYRIGVVHGRMTAEEKNSILVDFRSLALQVLVSTTLIEVGIDVPNATLMLIENCERFGLAQLHQLRGRISRGKYPGFCAVAPSDFLFQDAEPEKKPEAGKTRPKSGKSKRSKKAAEERKAEDKRREEIAERLNFFAQTTDGFELAEKDFALRGPGTLFGERQHGAAALRVADLASDRDLLDMAREDAIETVQQDPALEKEEHVVLRRQVLNRYGDVMDLGDVG